MAATILLCNQRSCWLALIFVAANLLSHKKGLNIRSIEPRIAIILLSVGMILFTGLYKYRPESANGRLLVAKIAITELGVAPLFGNGVGSILRDYLRAQSTYFSKPQLESEKRAAGEVYTVYNDYLLAYIDSGVIGCALLLIYSYLLFKNYVFRKERSGLARAAISSVICYYIIALVSYPSYSLSVLLLLFLSFAILDSKPSDYAEIAGSRGQFILSISTVILLYRLSLDVVMARDSYRWKALSTANFTSVSESLRKYEEILPSFTNNSEFLYEYGKVLMMFGESERSLHYLIQASKGLTKVDLFLALGKASENLSDNNRAEFYYLYAANIVPHRFTAQYYLWKLYRDTGRKAEKDRLAKKILGQSVKISSESVDDMLNEIRHDIEIHD